MEVAPVQYKEDETTQKNPIEWMNSFRELLFPMWKAGGSLSKLVKFFRTILTNREGPKNWQIVFSIDEIAKVNGTNKNDKNVKIVLDFMVNQMSADLNTWCITTALENTTLAKIEKDSRRPIPLFQLQRPSPEQVEKIFSNIYARAPMDRTSLDTLLSYSGFHFRTLQYIYQILNNDRSEKISLESVLSRLTMNSKLESFAVISFFFFFLFRLFTL